MRDTYALERMVTSAGGSAGIIRQLMEICAGKAKGSKGDDKRDWCKETAALAKCYEKITGTPVLKVCSNEKSSSVLHTSNGPADKRRKAAKQAKPHRRKRPTRGARLAKA